MEGLIEALGGMAIITGMVLIVYFIGRYTFLIKKMLAEKGLLEKRSEGSFNKVDVAYIVIGIGIGLVISAGLAQFNMEERTFDLLNWAIVLISGALGLIIAANQKR